MASPLSTIVELPQSEVLLSEPPSSNLQPLSLPILEEESGNGLPSTVDDTQQESPPVSPLRRASAQWDRIRVAVISGLHINDNNKEEDYPSNMMTLAGQSLLRHIQNRDQSAVGNLITNGTINLDERDEEGQTFLMVACQGEGETAPSREIAQMLIQHIDTDVNAVDNDNWTALLNAAKYGHHEIVTDLLRAGADIEHRDMGGWTALIWGCYKGRTEVVRVLLEAAANPNVKGEHHISCLTWAAGRGYTEIVRLLLDQGAKVNTADKYGTTPLIWASRKGHKDIVEALLQEGASVDNAGMNSWTALILAAKGGYADVADAILECNPNLNSTDKDGFTALTLAAKDGYTHIVNALLRQGAYVNLPDRYGDTILIHAVKGGHLEVVNALLKKYVDVNVQGVDNKTALYWAVEKGHTPVAKALLDHHADPEISNKDNDTPLLKAVRSRNLDLVQMLIAKGAKVTDVDKRGDTALHISVRGRSKRITEVLLRNPKDSCLLYKPNKYGETPYQIDTTHQRSILTQIFGTRNLNAEESISGYDLYSSTIADVLSDPSLRTPITVGLYAKWGSGKSSLIGKLQKEMRAFTQHNLDPPFTFTLLQFFLSLILSLIVGGILFYTVGWPYAVGIGCGLMLLQYTFLGIVWVGDNIRDWTWADKVSAYLARRMNYLQLFLQVCFCNEPERVNAETAAVKFLFTKNARLASVVGEKSITAMIGVLCDALEQEYGVMVSRLYRVIEPGKAADSGRFKTICCVPYFVLVVFVLLCIVTGFCLLGYYGVHGITDSNYTAVDSILIAFSIIVGVTIIGHLYKWSQMAISLVISSKRRINKISTRISSLKIEGVMQSLKKEVEIIGKLTRCADAFLNTSTRLVVIVDGLDSCEQEKLLQVLDTVHMLFGDTGSPFITILAVDPHVVIKGIEHNIHGNGLFHDSSINGHDYLRNIVHLPFFLQGQAAPPPVRRMDSVCESSSTHGSAKFSKNHSGSIISLNKAKKDKRSKSQSASRDDMAGSSLLVHAPSNFDLSQTFTKNSYFSDINPKNLRRLKNIVAVTGRLLRAYHIEFNWYRLASWINITEQWPYRLSWIIQFLEDHPDLLDAQSLKAVYDSVSGQIPISKEIDPLLEIDRNVRKLEVFLANHKPPLSVGDLRKFLPCTINVDPYLRKLIREMQHNESLMNELNLGGRLPSLPSRQDLLQDPSRLSVSGKTSIPQINSFTAMQALHAAASSQAQPASTLPMPSQMMPYGMYPNPQGYYPSSQQSMMPGMSAQFQAGPQQQALPTGLQQPSNFKVPLMQGVSPGIPLSEMTVDDVCDMIGRLSGISARNIARYHDTLQQQNISGYVLMNCQLSELKKEMGMSFGDWELFRALVDAMKTKEAMGAYSNMKASGFDARGAREKEAHGENEIEVEVLKAPQIKNLIASTSSAPSMKVTPNMKATRENSQPAETMVTTGLDKLDGVLTQEGQKKALAAEKRAAIIKRDSVVGLLMYENEALRAAMGDLDPCSEDSGASADEGITFDPAGSDADEEEESAAGTSDTTEALLGEVPEGGQMSRRSSRSSVLPCVPEEQAALLSTEGNASGSKPGNANVQDLPGVASVPIQMVKDKESGVPKMASGPALPVPFPEGGQVLLQSTGQAMGDVVTKATAVNQMNKMVPNLEQAEQGECSSVNSLDNLLFPDPRAEQCRANEDMGGPSVFMPISPANTQHQAYEIAVDPAFVSYKPSTRMQASGTVAKSSTGASGQPPSPDYPDSKTDGQQAQGLKEDAAKEVIVNVEGKTVKVSLSRDESFI